ncbi:MAG: sporulation protein YqfD [Bacillota bacterium]|nr:sporulation protein YqfD [Bacillota bacterium]
MANKFFDQVGGVIKVSVNGQNPEKILNLAMSRGVYIWDIKRVQEGVQLKIRNSGLEALQTLTDEYGYEIFVLEQQGMPLYKKVLKRRMGFLGGLVFFIMTLYVMSSFVWFVEVSGNAKMDKAQILTTAARYGVYQGAAKWNFSRNEVEEAMLRDLSELSYVQVDIQGVKAHINVVEKILPDQAMTGPCHIVACRDGVVEEVLVLEGQANVEKGQVVARGDILISGIVFPPVPYVLQGTEEMEESEPYSVRARGKVKAKTWYEGYGECKLQTETKVLTGKEAKIITVETPWKTIDFKGIRIKTFNDYVEESKMNHLQTPLGSFVFRSTIKKEQNTETQVYSPQEAIEVARRKALGQLHKELKGSVKINESSVDILSAPSDAIIRLKIRVEVIEDISQAQPLNAARIGK